MNSPNIDLVTLFQIWNPLCRYNSCVGYAPTRRKRCGWEMDNSNVVKQLNDIANKLPHVHPNRAELVRVATDTLCHHHKRQASDIATKWKNLIDNIDLEDLSERMRNAHMNDDSFKPRSGGSQSEREEAKRKQEEKERQERAHEEESRKKQEEEERRRREERAKEDARKEQEREDREAEGERRSWRQAWTRYAEAQRMFKEKKVCISSEMPWPVKSGLRKDVNEQNVVAFYHNALPGSSANEFYKIMQQECLIWHPDKIYQFIASLTLTTPEEESMAVIARMVIKLHKDFRRRRTS